MGLHTGLILIKGNHSPFLNEIFPLFHYHLTDDVKSFTTWEDTIKYVSERANISAGNIFYRACFVVEGWTVLYDPELVMIEENEACIATARRLHNSVFGASCATVTSSFRFRSYSPNLSRSFLAVDGQIVEDEGDCLPEEEGLYPVDDVEKFLDLLKRFGIDYDHFDRASGFQVFGLQNDSAFSSPIPDASPPRPSRKPWWRFW